MRILVFSDHFYPEPSAPAAHVFERAKKWVEMGHDVTVICSAPNFPEGKVYDGYTNAWRTVEDLSGVRVVRVKTYVTVNEGTFRRTLDYCSYSLSSSFFSLFEQRPDVILSTSPHLFIPVAGVFAAMSRRVPHVFEIRDLWPASLVATGAMSRSRILQGLEKLELWLYRRSERVMTLTPSFKRDLVSRGVSDGKIDVVVNGANLDLFRPMEVKDAEIVSRYGLEDRFVVGYLGTIGLAHGLENVVAAAEHLRDTDVCFFFVGVGAAKRTLEEMVAKKGLSNVVFAPRQLKEDMPRFWSVCDLSLIHLKDDPVFGTVIPSKIFESMAVGVAALYCVPRGDGSDIVEKHQTGLVVPPMNPEKLAEAVMSLRNDEALRRKFAESSKAAAGKFSRHKQAEASLAVLRQAAEEYGSSQ
ncbi:glycosyltransferase family 4 protein [Lentisalinibacter salinarum]|uniref:glycosyltransferase family 4 protein n=1 Tax=Lentisalinibacter salinarum TaxID=2992239 RepID=UPI00386A4A28